MKKSVGNIKIDEKATDFDSLKCSLLEKFSSENPHFDLIEIESKLPEFKEGFLIIIDKFDNELLCSRCVQVQIPETTSYIVFLSDACTPGSVLLRTPNRQSRLK